jgi:Type I phosphodiesterase / nucleotide pyrophosphatase
MLPAPKTDRLSLADVMPSCLAALAGRGSGASVSNVSEGDAGSLFEQANRLRLPAVSGAVVLLVDGLGAETLAARAGHARTLAGALTPASTFDTVFPTTTASAIATLTTGVAPGQHGLVGYTVLDEAHDRVVNQLTGWDANLDPYTWQPAPTAFETAAKSGVAATAIGPTRYDDTGFSRAVLRGARYVAAETISDRLARAREQLGAGGGLVYVYVPELDRISHAAGSASDGWSAQLESLDGAVRDFIPTMPKGTGLLVTADHGSIDVPRHSHVHVDALPGLLDGIRFIAGEPRCLQLHFEPDLSTAGRVRLIAAWLASESDRSWVVTRSEAIEAGWFGDVRDEVRPRIGDLIVAARKRVAYYDSRTATSSAQAMIGQHGSWAPSELRIPLLRFGSFAPR